MLEIVMLHIHNWFVRDVHEGHYVINHGQLELPFLLDGQYYRIIGSVFNDGLHQYGNGEALADEAFCGEIWALAPPKAFLELVGEIGDWVVANRSALDSPYTSENVIGVYSYTLKDGVSGGGAGASNGISWQAHFRSRLNAWRKIAP